MFALWAVLNEPDVETYVGTVVLPSYLAHLHLDTFRFSRQVANRNGREPLRATYLGEGRMEEFELYPEDHSLGMIRSVLPKVKVSEIRLPDDDACWHWSVDRQSASDPKSMRVYFSPRFDQLETSLDDVSPEEAHVSVTRGHVFVGSALLERYLSAQLARLGIDAAGFACRMPSPNGGIEFSGSGFGGHWSLSESSEARDVLRYAALDGPLEQVGSFVRLDLDATGNQSGIRPDGLYLPVSPTE